MPEDPFATQSPDQPVPIRASVDAAAMPQRIGKFRIERILGHGGFGVVYLGLDEQLQRKVAIKVPKPQFVQHAEDRELYLKEARTVAGLEHPNIVPVHEVGSTPEFPIFIVSKFIVGSDLASHIRSATPTYVQSVHWMIDLADALREAHRKGFVHRDIKPQNILVDQDERVYLVDFGLALADRDVGKRLPAGGTPAYMSPEQVRGEGHRVDGRSDLFSLGILFYEMLCGRRPFQGSSQLELFEQITELDPKPLRQWVDSVPQELERICFKMLCKRKSDRYSSAKDLADDLKVFISNVQRDSPSEESVRPPNPNSANIAKGSGSDETPVATTPTSGSRTLKIVPKGLRSFDHRDADFFLELLPGARDRDGLPESVGFWKSRIEERDADQTFEIGLLYGPSGCGKSSMMKAGLLPRIAKNIVPIYLEATADDTERTLLALIRKKLDSQEADSTKSLVELLHEVRLGRILPRGKKLLIVIDQFEQWLFAHPNAAGEPLLESLLQCDGVRVQAIVMVRDDFWMAATRFFQELDIRLVEGTNSAAVDLFSIVHAERVLKAFGRAFGTLESDGKEDKQDRNQFITDSVRGLSEDGKVISVRLSLFAEMMKGKPWTPESLREVGGTRGVGATFLEETFSASGAPPQHRFHQEAARSVLRALLPQSGTNIKGHKRSIDELRVACHYDGRPRDFDDLVRMLDSELRLITPVDSSEQHALAATTTETPSTIRPLETATQAEPKGLAPVTQYQLTHDYLVPSLRDWLTRKQRETRRGRAQLKLDERAAAWNAKRESKQLPTLLEWIEISILCVKRQRSEPKRIMMRNATSLHLTRIGLVSMFVLTASMLTPIMIESQRETKRLRELRLRIVAIEDEIQELTVDGLSSPSLVEKLPKLEKDDRESYFRLSQILDRRQYQLLDEVLKQPRLSISQFDQLESWVSTVRSSENRQILRDRLEKRRSSWNEVLSYSPPFENVSNLQIVPSADEGEVVVFDSKKLLLAPATNNSKIFSLVNLPVLSQATEQLTVEFNEDWSDAKHIGLYLDGNLNEAEQLQGWIALVTVGKSRGNSRGDAELDTFNVALKSNTPILFQLMRSQEAIVYQEIDPSEIVGKPLRLRFQRDGDEFQLQVNQRPEIRFDECFSMRSNGVGAPGIFWPKNVTINSILLEGIAANKVVQPLEQADELYRNSNFEDALNLYTTLRTQSSISELNNECLFKMGLTYAQLQNLDSATNAFQELIESAKSKWSIRAGCELLKIRWKKGDFTELVGILQVLRTKFQPSEVSKYVSIDSRNELADLLVRRNLQTDWVQRKDQFERTQFVADAFEAIDRPLSDKVKINTVLLQEKSTRGEISVTLMEAREFALSVMNNPKSSQLDIESVVETWLHMTMNAGVRDSGDELLDLAEKRVASIVNSDSYRFVKFRAEWANFMDRYSEALDYCHQAKRQWHGESPDYWAELLTGWIYHSMGDETQAKETWKSAFLRHKDNESTILAVAIMGSLSDTVSSTTAEQMFARVMKQYQGEIAVNFLKPYFPTPLIRQGSRYMWQTDYGKEMARRIGTSQCSFRERSTGQLSVSAYCFLKRMTLDNPEVYDLTPRDFDVEIRTSCETMRTGFEEARLSQQDFLSLMIAYLGNGGFFGINGVATNKNFTSQEKAIMGYCLGCHMVREARTTDAKKAFQLGANSKTPVIAKLSAKKLEELDR